MIVLDGSSLTIEQLIAIADERERVQLSSDARARVSASRAVVERRARGNEPAYGINTGFGSFADVTIAPDALEALQLNLLRSHAAGVGAPLSARAVRATMALRANVLAKGFSGVRVDTLEALIALINAAVHPFVPSRGSVGASGDLAPLAHLALVLIGEGEVLVDDREAAERSVQASGVSAGFVPARYGLARAGLTPITLGPKEGLALINGTQPSTAVLALALADVETLARAADIVAALSIDALRGSIHPFEARIHEARPFAGQLASASNIAALIHGSGINKSHEFCGRVQDAYSLRCAAQVGKRSASSGRPSPWKRTARPTTRWSLPTQAISSPAATSTGRRSRSPPTSWRRQPCRWRRSASEGPIGSSIRRSAGCRRFSREKAASIPVS